MIIITAIVVFSSFTDMSVEDDEDFCKKLVQQSSKIIANEIAKVTKQLNVERKERQKLEARVKEMDTEFATARGDIQTLQGDIHRLQGDIQTLQVQQIGCTCKNDLFKAFNAAMVSITQTETSVQDYGTEYLQQINQYPTADYLPLYQSSQVSATPVQLAPVAGTPVRSDTVTASASTVRSTPVTSSASTKSKRRRIEATSQFITDIELVSWNLKGKIRPFYKPNPMATQDLLNDVQRAFIKFKADQVHSSGESITAAFIQSVIHEGTEERIWSNDFNPRGSSGTFTDYLSDRIKNERKILRRVQQLFHQQEQVEHFLDESMKECDEP